MKLIKSLSIAFAMVLCAMPAYAQFTTGGSRNAGMSGSGDFELKTGYKGFVDLGYGIGVGDYSTGRVEFQTTHGYQVVPYFFAGIGAGVSYYHEGEAWSVPIYADFRGSLPIANTRLAPFIDFKIGYAAADVSGFYFSPSIGTRIAINERLGFNFSLGYELQKQSAETYYYDYYYDDIYITDEKVTLGAFSIKIGIDF